MSRHTDDRQQKGISLVRTVSKIVAVALCCALLVPMAGCKHRKKSPSATIGDPSVTGSITVYTSLPQDEADTYLGVFKKAYPNVNVNLVRDTAPAIAARLVKEKKAPVADVVWHTPLSAVTAAEEASALASYVYPPGQYDAVQGDYADGDNPSAPQFVATDARLIGWVVNSSKTGGAVPATFSDLIDPKYKGQIVMPSVNTEAGYTIVAALLSSMGEDSGWPYLDSLDQNVSYYTSDDAAPAKAVQNGEAGVALGWDTDIVAAGNSGGAQTVWPGQPEMSPFDLDVDALVNKSSPSNVAKTFLNWAISDDAMNAYAKNTPVTAVDEGNGVPSGYPTGNLPDQFMQNMDFQYLAENHDKIVAEWMKRYGKKIKAQ